MKKFKKIFSVLFAFVLLTSLYGCKDNEPGYRVICADHFENVKESYKAGEKVEIYDPMPEGDNISVYYYVDAEQPDTWIPDPDSQYVPGESKYTITFIMPNHDVELTRKIEHNIYN